MTHLDLFSGIGGFAYAADQVWDNVEHIFCDNDPFCKQVLAKHWPESEIYDDVRTISTPPYGSVDILTGGFPCQSFSQAGLRRGTDDVRWLWPEMFKVIQATRPTWVIAENVNGILTWGQGVAAEQVCADLEAAGYEVQPFIIPAAAVGAPHRRDRIWFVAHTAIERLQGSKRPSKQRNSRRFTAQNTGEQYSWNQNWLKVATALCGVDDGISKRLVRLPDGNAIVPQVAIEIMRGMAL